ncbi:MAG: CNNM domain-containing protein, partial [Bacillota bacterium]
MQSFVNELLIIIVLIGVNAFFAAAEIAILSVRDVRIRQLAEDGHSAAKTVLRLTEDSSRMLATIQIGITLAGFMASAAAAVGISSSFNAWIATLPIPWLVRIGPALSVVLVTLLISYFTLVFGELAPKRLALQKAESIALWVA